MDAIKLVRVDDLKHKLSCDCGDCQNCEWLSLDGVCECRWSLKELKQMIDELPQVSLLYAKGVDNR